MAPKKKASAMATLSQALAVARVAADEVAQQALDIDREALKGCYMALAARLEAFDTEIHDLVSAMVSDLHEMRLEVETG
jgi:hypothetical protein